MSKCEPAELFLVFHPIASQQSAHEPPHQGKGRCNRAQCIARQYVRGWSHTVAGNARRNARGSPTVGTACWNSLSCLWLRWWSWSPWSGEFPARSAAMRFLAPLQTILS